jgi:hypothetical protein
MAAPASLYRVFDLVLGSNVPIPALPPLDDPVVPDITVHFGSWPDAAARSKPADSPDYQSPFLDGSGVPILRIWCVSATTYRLSYVNGLEFLVNYADREIWSLWQGSVDFQDAASFLLGPVLGILLRLQGRVCLHASAVAYKDSTLVFAGSPGAGKSTLAAALSCRGLAVVSDDIVLLTKNDDAQFCAVPSHPFLSLWPESVELIDRKSNELPRVFSQMEKRRLLLETSGRFESRSLPIGAVYVLDHKKASTSDVAMLSRQDALLALVTESYGTYVLTVERRSSELNVLGELVNEIPVLSVPSDPQKRTLAQLCQLVLSDYDQRNG